MLKGFIDWPDDYKQKYLNEGYWKNKCLGEIVDDAVKKYADRVAIAFNGKQITYAEMAQKVERLALHLLDMGHKPLDRMIMQMPNIPETIYIYFAAVKVGIIPIMTLAAHRMAEIGFFAQFAEATSYCIPGTFRKFNYIDMAEEIRRKAPSLKKIIVNKNEAPPDMISLPELLNDPIEERVNAKTILENARPDPFDPALFQLSGGTTGIPKLIPRTHNDYYYNTFACQELCGFNQDTVYLVGIPITHNFVTACPGWQGIFMSGGKVVISPSPAPDVMLSLIEQEGVTIVPAVPAVIVGIMSNPDLKKYDISSLKVIHTGGSKLNPEVAKQIRPTLGADFQEILGMAEGPLFWTRLDDPEKIKVNTQGRPLSPGDEFKIVDNSGKEVAAGETGELLCRGPYTIRGYFSSPEYNAKAFTDDGFYKSGDLCRLHFSGNIIVEGRSKDTVNRGGEKISAEEVENHILSFPKVRYCAYVAMPDPVLGERPAVFVVPAEGQNFALEELNDYLLKKRRIARYKLPERLEIVAELPLTNIGKVNKVRLREIIAAQLKQEKN